MNQSNREEREGVLFPVGTVMQWKDGTNAYQKMGGEEFDWWRSLQFDLDKQLKERYGFKWTDNQVKNYYGNISNFVKP